MKLVHRIALRISIGFSLLTAGCSTLQSTPEGQTPEDFAVSLTILSGQPGDGATEPAWYILEPDGVLRAISGSRVADSRLPPAVRHLDNDEVQTVHQVCAAAGLFEDVPPGFELAAEPPPPQQEWNAVANSQSTVNRVFVAFRGKRRSYIPVEGSTALEPIAAKLRELAWMDR